MLIEIAIAIFFRDGIIRPLFGDFLVVILIYCAVKAFLNISPLKTGLAVLVFAFTVEILQYYKLVELLGVQDNKILTIILGSTFDWFDLVAYTLGVGVVLFLEKRTTFFK